MRLLPASATGCSSLGVAAATKAWSQLVNEPASMSIVVTRRGASKILSFAAAVFVSNEFARSEANQPQPGLTDRFLQAYAGGAPVCLTRAQIGDASAHDGLEQLELCSNETSDLDASTASEARMLMADARIALTRGYRLAAAFGELITPFQVRHAESVGSTIVNFDDGTAFFRVTRASLELVPGALGILLFHYRPPTLRLREPEQSLLLAALDGATDEELASTFGIGLANLKARWRSLFRRIDALQPDWWRVQDGELRGPRRRHLLLAYCREHPEELRPYDWDAAAR